MTTEKEAPQIDLQPVIDWHTQQRRLMMAGSMAIGEAIEKARFHEKAVQILTQAKQALTERQ